MPPKKRKATEKSAGKKPKKAKTTESIAPIDFEDSTHEKDTLLFCGTRNWKLAKDPAAKSNILGFTRVGSLAQLKVSKVFAGCTAFHFAAICDTGCLYMFGSNSDGQLGLGDTINRDAPVLVTSMETQEVTQVAIGRHHTLALTSRGHVWSCGENKSGQLGLGSLKSTTTFTKIPSDEKFVKVACGGEFSAILNDNGVVFTFGHPEHGQLGNNTEGKYFVTSSKLSFHFVESPTPVTVYCEKDNAGRAASVDNVFVTDISCGAKHTLALDRDKNVYSWGFGGYGRLGHSSANTELVPRLISNFKLPGYGAVKIATGGSCSMAVGESTQLFFWGQTKSSGEATTYPKPEYELSGWNIDNLAIGNKHIVVVATDGVVSWAGAPTCGELGYGEKEPKSSTKPKIIDSLANLTITDAACGYSNTLLVVENGTESQASINAFDCYELVE